MDKQPGTTFTIVIFGLGIVLILLSYIMYIQAGPSMGAEVLKFLGTGFAGYAPIRLIIAGVQFFDEQRKSRSIRRLFSRSVRVEKEVRDLPLLFVSDVEGCITPPKRSDIDLTRMARLRRYCEFAKANSQYPRIILYTGRSQGYVEMLAQSLGMLDIYPDIPFVIENGAALYQPTSRKTHPLISRQQEIQMLDIRKELASRYPTNEFEPKAFMISINPHDGQTVDELREEVTLTLKDIDRMGEVAITSTASAVDISPKGIGKLYGVERALKFLDGYDFPLDKVVAFGDQVADLEVLRRVGRVYCPAEYAHPEIRAHVEAKSGRDNIIKESDVDFVVAAIERECGLKII